MDNSTTELPDGDSERAYHLPTKLACSKHPSKSIQYFCKHPQCPERLACSSCLLKKQYCRHDINTHIVDIAQFLYDQKEAFNMRGLAKEADIFDYVANKAIRRQMYDDIVDTQITNFQKQLVNMLGTITKTINDLRDSVKGQLEEFKQSYQKTEELLLSKVEESFTGSFIAKFATFQEILDSRDISTSIGLRELLEKMAFEVDHSRSKEIRKYYENLIFMHDETPEIDYSRFQGIKSYFNVFESKLNQAGPILITLHKGTTPIASKDFNINALLEPMSSAPITSMKKVAKSTSFPSNHLRTIYTLCRLPDKKLCTGSDDGALHVFSLSTFQQLAAHQLHVGGIRSMILLPNGKLVTGSYDKTIKIWPDPSKMGDLPFASLQNSQVSVSAMSASGRKVVPINALKTLTGHSSCIISLKYLNDGITFASGSADYSIKVWDFERGENVKNFTGHMSDVLCLDCSSNGGILVSGSADRTVKVWSLTKKYSSACLKTLTGHIEYIWTIVLLQDNVTLLSGGLDKIIKMWDITTGNLLRNLPTEHTSHITKLLQYSKDVVVSCSNDGTVKFWDVKGMVCVHTVTVECPITIMIALAQGGLALAGQDKAIHMCD